MGRQQSSGWVVVMKWLVKGNGGDLVRLPALDIMESCAGDGLPVSVRMGYLLGGGGCGFLKESNRVKLDNSSQFNKG